MKVVKVERKEEKIYIDVADGYLDLWDDGEFMVDWIEIDTENGDITYFGAYRSRPSEPWLKAEIFVRTTDEALKELIENPAGIEYGIPWEDYQIFPPTTKDLKKLGILGKEWEE